MDRFVIRRFSGLAPPGNFPQAFTHLSLISAAYNLDRTLEGKRGMANSNSAMGIE